MLTTESFVRLCRPETPENLCVSADGIGRCGKSVRPRAPVPWSSACEFW